MKAKLINGDYSKNESGTGLIAVGYIDELLQNAMLALTAKRGRFYPNKNFGSHIAEISPNNPCEYAIAFAQQAVDMLDGIFVKKAEINGENIEFTLIINDEERQVSIELENDI